MTMQGGDKQAKTLVGLRSLARPRFPISNVSMGQAWRAQSYQGLARPRPPYMNNPGRPLAGGVNAIAVASKASKTPDFPRCPARAATLQSRAGDAVRKGPFSTPAHGTGTALCQR